MSASSGSPSVRGRLAAIVTACVVWGSAFLFGKVALAEIPPAHLVLERFVLGCAVLVPIALARRSLPRRGDLPLLAATGFLGVPVTFLLQFEGLARTTVASASLIVGSGAPLVALLAAVFDGDRLDRAGWAAVGLSTGGVALLLGLPSPGRTVTGDLLVLLSMVAAAGYILLTVRLLRRYDAIGATAWSLALGTLALGPIAWAWEGAPRTIGHSGPVVASVLVLGLGCTALTYLLWNWGLVRVPASRAGVYLNLEPLVGAFLGVLLLGEPTTVGLAGGGTAILLAAVWISLPRSTAFVADSAARREIPPRPGLRETKELPCRDRSPRSSRPCCSARRAPPLPRRPCPTRSATASAGRTRPASSTPSK